MPKIVDKKLMQETIIIAAINAFSKYGFAKTTMVQIAQEANLAKGTLYLYFKSKKELLSNISEMHFSKLKEGLIPDEYFTNLDTLLAYIEKALLVDEEEAKFIPIFFEAFGAQLSNDEFMGQYREIFKTIGEFYASNFQLLIDKKEIKSSINPDALGRVLVSMLDGIILHKGFFKIPENEHDFMIKNALLLFKNGLKNR